jgi:hypothetical protein
LWDTALQVILLKIKGVSPNQKSASGIFVQARSRLLLAAQGQTMVSFETFREYLLRQLAELLKIQVEGLDAWEIWLAIHERCPEAARIASDQWTKKELLEQHLRNVEYVRAQDYDWMASQHVSNKSYMYYWSSLQAQIQQAVAKKKRTESEYR